MEKVTATLVRSSNGQINIQETLNAFQAQLNTYLLKENADLEQIEGYVEEFWTENEGLKSVSIDALASQVFNKMSMPFEAFKDATDRIKNYIRSAGDTYGVMRGKDGGVVRLDRLTSEEVAKVRAQAEKLATTKSAKAAKAA